MSSGGSRCPPRSDRGSPLPDLRRPKGSVSPIAAASKIFRRNHRREHGILAQRYESHIDDAPVADDLLLRDRIEQHHIAQVLPRDDLLESPLAGAVSDAEEDCVAVDRAITGGHQAFEVMRHAMRADVAHDELAGEAELRAQRFVRYAALEHPEVDAVGDDLDLLRGDAARDQVLLERRSDGDHQVGVPVEEHLELVESA